ncbi:MAG: histidinol-phosphate transaminase [Opitutales bacterium]|nr:histidinol-phosphate transaminase [Opitutales bacterium]
MNYKDLANKVIENLPEYVPGKPVEYVAREFGIDPSTIEKMASNENPFGASPKAIKAVKAALAGTNMYPDGAAIALRERLAKFWDLSPEQFFIGNGSNEALMILAQTILNRDSEVIYGDKSFIVYKIATTLAGAKSVTVPMPDFSTDLKAIEAAITAKTRIIFITNPNNPQGTICDPQELLAFAERLPDHVILVLDEAYAEFADGKTPDMRPLIAAGKKIVVARTFSKLYGLAGFRCGYMFGNKEIIALMNRVRQPFNSNLLAQTAGLAAIDDVAFVKKTLAGTKKGIKKLCAGFKKLKLDYVPTYANFILVHIGPDAKEVFVELQRRGLIVRPMGGYDMPEHLRITVGTPKQNERLLAALGEILKR